MYLVPLGTLSMFFHTTLTNPQRKCLSPLYRPGSEAHVSHKGTYLHSTIFLLLPLHLKVVVGRIWIWLCLAPASLLFLPYNKAFSNIYKTWHFQRTLFIIVGKALSYTLLSHIIFTIVHKNRSYGMEKRLHSRVY